MKKILSLILALALVMSLSVTAFAATNDGTENTSIDVNALYSDGVSLLCEAFHNKDNGKKHKM